MSKSLMNRSSTAVVVMSLLVVAAGCSHSKPVAAPEVGVSEPEPDVATMPENPPPTTEVSSEPSMTPAESPEGSISSGALPADVEAINRAGYLRDAFFDTNKSDLTAEARDVLAADGAWLKQHSSVLITIQGHADERNTEEYNLALGWRRANSVKDYLVSLGVDAGRISVISYGEERPFVLGDNESAWAQNRRAHLVVTAR